MNEATPCTPAGFGDGPCFSIGAGHGLLNGGVEGKKLGPFGPTALKPYSRTRFAVDGNALLKVYVDIDPEGRCLREAATVQQAALLGIRVPSVLATGTSEAGSWTVFRTVPGTPCSIGTREATKKYIIHVSEVSGRLHKTPAGTTPGSGWDARRSGPAPPHRFLLEQFSPRCRLMPWWEALDTALRPIDAHPVVRLHGDLKPEHFLVDGERVHVVGWEASACGPAVLDYTDVAFHLVRDLVYEGVPPGDVPVDLLTGLPFSGPALAWRLLLWLDRRRVQDIDRVTLHDVHRFAAEQHAAAAHRTLAQTIARLRATGVPR
ncbi:aminoglycoside phosphotransferase family protein [Streptomyces sp. NPDC057545]|uniref:aminoglycoside phosphotransferase family protein n=1 Tax=Streptomyces sp. NPDC057545 TaxID=3346164 RepID=UPI0036C73CE8